MDASWQISAMLVALFLVPAALVYLGWRRGRLVSALVPVVVALLGLWGLSVLAVETDFRDADGFVDCWPSCSALQHGVRLGFLGVLPVLAILAMLTAVLLWISARRGRAAPPRG